jgi:hypothetical protein
MLLYCDVCAEKYGYETTLHKEKGGCHICQKRLGSMNVMMEGIDEYYEDREHKKIGPFKFKQLKNSFPGAPPTTIEPRLSSRRLNDDTILFFNGNHMIIARPSTGEKVKIDYSL